MMATGYPLTILSLQGRIDIRTATDLRLVLDQIINEGHCYLLLNLAEVSFMDSSGLGAIMSAFRRCYSLQGNLCICEVPENVNVVLQYTAQQDVLDTFQTEAEALDHFPPQPLSFSDPEP